MKTILITILFCLTSVSSAFESEIVLQKTISSYCRGSEVFPIAFSYSSKITRLYHSSLPLQKNVLQASGKFEVNEAIFLKSETIKRDNNVFRFEFQYDGKDALSKNSVDSTFLPQTNASLLEQPISLALYSPIPLLKYCKSNIDNLTFESTKHRSKIVININENTVSIFINKSTNLVDSISVIYFDSFYGNVKNVYRYQNITSSSFSYPSEITYSKLNGLVYDTVKCSHIEDNKQFLSAVKIPKDYSYSPTIRKVIEISDTMITPQISALRVKSEFIQSYLVEFSDFLVVLEAPLSSEIGEMIFQYGMKKFPTKPIKYVCYSHHHPHYTGGLRPFVHRNIPIVSLKQNNDYFTMILKNSHSLQPDSLEISKKSPIFVDWDNTMTITDGKDSLILFHFGIRSNHTYDYTLFYRPKEKILFVGDIIWVSIDNVIQKASPGQKGMYDFIKEKAIPVETIYQAWPVMSPKYKTIIPFSELKASAEKK